MQTYIGTKQLRAKPMTRGDYNLLQGWTLPPDQDGNDEGYLVEYLDGGKANHPDFTGYISWSPKDVFERTYRAIETETSSATQEKAVFRSRANEDDLRARAMDYASRHSHDGPELVIKAALAYYDFLKGAA